MYLILVEHKSARVLRSSCERRLEPSTVPGTLQDSAAMLFNSLPQDIKIIHNSKYSTVNAEIIL